MTFSAVHDEAPKIVPVKRLIENLIFITTADTNVNLTRQEYPIRQNVNIAAIVTILYRPI